jgi:hypothetical protein
MNPTILVAIISFSGSIILASLSYFFTKQQQIKTEWQHEKMNHYKVLLSALSDLAVSGRDKRKGQENFSLATNTICLVAPQYVVKALMDLHHEIQISNRDKYSPENEYVLVNKLMLAIRKDIGLSKKDNEKTFEFHFIGYNPEYEK